MNAYDEGYFEDVELVPAKQKGFLTCSNCHRPLLEMWSWGAKHWNYCPVCGRHIRPRKEGDREWKV